MKINKIKIGVLMGGRSIEREVSFNSGRTICDHLDLNIYNIFPIFQDLNGDLYFLPWYFLHRGKISDFEDRLDYEAEKIIWDNLKERVDFIYLAIHGKYCEDGSIQGMLEFLKIPFSGSSFLTGAISSNKYLSGNILKNNKINVPKNFLIKKGENNYLNFINIINKNISFPVIVKPNEEGSSFGINIAKNEEELINFIEIAKNVNKNYQNDVLIEEKINGMEFSCVLLEKDEKWIAFEPTEIVHKEDNYIFEYNDKYMPGSGEKYTPGRFSKESINIIKETCLRIVKILNAKDILRIDGFLLNNNEIIIIDCNIFPGTAPSSFTFIQASLHKISNTELINHIVFNALKRYNKFDQFLIKNINYKDNMLKMRIGILLGGNNNEKEVSLESGRNIFYKLLSLNKYELTPLFLTDKKEKNENFFFKLNMDQLAKNRTDEVILSLSNESRVLISDFKKLFDFIFIGLHGGEGENGCIQGVLETLNIPYNGSGIFSSAVCMDKYFTYKILENNNINVPKHFLINKNDDILKIKECFLNLKKSSNKIILKPNDDGCSFMVNAFNSLDEFIDGVKNIFHHSNKMNCLIEECIEDMELTVGVIGDDNLLIMPPSYTNKSKDVLSLEEKFLPGEGENITPCPLPKEDINFISNEIKKVCKILNIYGYCRIDCFFKKENLNNQVERKLIILECNTLPGLTPATCIFHQAAEIGITPSEFLNKIIEIGLLKNKHY